MGQKGSKQEREYQQLLEQYELKNKFVDPRYGEVRLLEHKISKEQLILKEVMSSHQEDHKRNIQEYQHRKEFKSPYVLELKEFAEKVDAQFCSTFFKTYLLFEYSQETLDFQLSEKSQTKSSYSEEDLWYMLDCLVQGLAHLQNHRIYHGDLKPSNIFCSKNGVYKVADQGLFTSSSSYAFLLSDPNYPRKEIYLSPYLLKALQHNEFKPFHNIFKSDVYSLGMIMLYAASLESSDDIYNYFQFSIDKSLVEHRLNIVSEKYGFSLRSFIKDMLEEDEELRPDFQRLLEQLGSQERIRMIRITREPANQAGFSNSLADQSQNQSNNYKSNFDMKFESNLTNLSENLKRNSYKPLDTNLIQKQDTQHDTYNFDQKNENYDEINALLNKYGIESIGGNANINFNYNKTSNYDFSHNPLEYKPTNLDFKPTNYDDYKVTTTTVDYQVNKNYEYQPTNFDDFKPSNYESFKPSNFNDIKPSSTIEYSKYSDYKLDYKPTNFDDVHYNSQVQTNLDFKPTNFEDYKPISVVESKLNENLEFKPLPQYDFKQTKQEFNLTNFDQYKPSTTDYKQFDNYDFQPTNYDNFKPIQTYDQNKFNNYEFKPTNFEEFKPQNLISTDFKNTEYAIPLENKTYQQEFTKRSTKIENGDDLAKEVDQLLNQMKLEGGYQSTNEYQPSTQLDQKLDQYNPISLNGKGVDTYRSNLTFEKAVDYKPANDFQYKVEDYQPVINNLDYQSNPINNYKSDIYKPETTFDKDINYKLGNDYPLKSENYKSTNYDLRLDNVKPTSIIDIKATTTYQNDYKLPFQELTYDPQRPLTYEFNYEQYKLTDGLSNLQEKTKKSSSIPFVGGEQALSENYESKFSGLGRFSQQLPISTGVDNYHFQYIEKDSKPLEMGYNSSYQINQRLSKDKYELNFNDPSGIGGLNIDKLGAIVNGNQEGVGFSQRYSTSHQRNISGKDNNEEKIVIK